MILDRTHISWAAAFLVASMVSAALYVVFSYAAPGGASGGSVAGLMFGVCGSLLMLFCGLLGVRKKLPQWRIGSAQAWLRAHIWLGLLSVVLILCHAGFRWGGALEQMLMLVLAVVVLSGVFGLCLQQFLPRHLTARVPLETFYDQVPHVCAMLQFEGDVLVARLAGPLSVIPSEEVATEDRLKAREVKGRAYRDRLAAVYQQSESADSAAASVASASDATVKAAIATKTVATAEIRAVQNPPKSTAVAEAKSAKVGLSAAEKIALMKKAKSPASKQPAAAPSASNSPAASAAKKLSAAEKIAMMKAAKKTTPANSNDSQSSAAAAVSTADKIKQMRLGKPASHETQPGTDSPATDSKSPSPKTGSTAAAKLPKSPAAKKSSPAMAADENWRQHGPQLMGFYLDTVRPFLGSAHCPGDPLAQTFTAGGVFAEVRKSLPVEFHAPLGELENLCDERRQLAVQRRIHFWLHSWLIWVHLPASAALLVLGVCHTVMSLYW